LDRQHYRWAFFIIVFLLASVYFFIFSDSGLLERIALDKEKNQIAAKIGALKSENKRLQRLLNNYRKGEYPEGEIADSGYIKNGGKVLFFQGLEKKARAGTESTIQADALPVPLPYLRITWIAISSIVVIVIIVYGRKHSDQS
jgi:cell division protein FtsB